MKKIGLIGKGVVGGALYQGMSDKFSIEVYDKFQTEHNSEAALNATFANDVIFVCVPTPTIDDKQDLTALHDVCRIANLRVYSGTLVVKSTVLPGTCDMLEATYGVNIVHNPEFLREKTAAEDFLKQKAFILGGHLDHVEKVAVVYQLWRGMIPVRAMKAQESEMLKYFHNCFLATKVAVFNEYFDLCQAMGLDFDRIRKGMLDATDNILANHTTVPGHDGSRGFGGMCFPKDTQALHQLFDENEVHDPILENVIAYNKTLRQDV